MWKFLKHVWYLCFALWRRWRTMPRVRRELAEYLSQRRSKGLVDFKLSTSFGGLAPEKSTPPWWLRWVVEDELTLALHNNYRLVEAGEVTTLTFSDVRRNQVRDFSETKSAFSVLEHKFFDRKDG